MVMEDYEERYVFSAVVYYTLTSISIKFSSSISRLQSVEEIYIFIN